VSVGAAPVSQVKPIVIVVDDDISVRESLELLICSAGWQPEMFASAQAFLSRPPGPTPTPTCLVLDIELPDLNGLELQERIAVDRNEMPIIFITGHADVPRAIRAMKGGAVEFLTKPFADDVLLQALRRAIERSRGALGQAAELKVLRERYASLTPREREVLPLVVGGLLNKQAAAELGISKITFQIHRGKVMRTMGAGSLAELVRMAGALEIPVTRSRRGSTRST
jgi:FixJ family two-component response regulator